MREKERLERRGRERVKRGEREGDSQANKQAQSISTITALPTCKLFNSTTSNQTFVNTQWHSF